MIFFMKNKILLFSNEKGDNANLKNRIHICSFCLIEEKKNENGVMGYWTPLTAQISDNGVPHSYDTSVFSIIEKNKDLVVRNKGDFYKYINYLSFIIWNRKIHRNFRNNKSIIDANDIYRVLKRRKNRRDNDLATAMEQVNRTTSSPLSDNFLHAWKQGGVLCMGLHYLMQ